MHIDINVKYPLFLSDFYQTLIFVEVFSKNPQISSFLEIRSVEAEMFHADWQRT
jgi:hypothetical protein